MKTTIMTDSSRPLEVSVHSLGWALEDFQCRNLGYFSHRREPGYEHNHHTKTVLVGRYEDDQCREFWIIYDFASEEVTVLEPVERERLLIQASYLLNDLARWRRGFSRLVDDLDRAHLALLRAAGKAAVQAARALARGWERRADFAAPLVRAVCGRTSGLNYRRDS